MYMVWCLYERYKGKVWKKYGQCMDIRVGLFNVSIDYETFVSII